MSRGRGALPDGVRLVDGELVDDVREGKVKLNPVAAALLAGALGGDSGAAAQRIANRDGVASDRVMDDLDSLIRRLNSLGFVNVPHAGGSSAWRAWATSTATSLLAGVLPDTGPLPVARRQSAGGVHGFRSGLAAMRGVLLRTTLFVFVAVAVATAVTGGGAVSAAAFALAAPTGIALHELAHLLALGGGPAAVLTTSFGVRVLHPPVPARRRRAVAAAGPLAPTLVGVVLVVCFAAAPTASVAAAAIPLVAHVLNLVVLAGDGRGVLTDVTHRSACAFGIGAAVGFTLAGVSSAIVDVALEPVLLVVAAAVTGLLNALASARRDPFAEGRTASV